MPSRGEVAAVLVRIFGRTMGEAANRLWRRISAPGLLSGISRSTSLLSQFAALLLEGPHFQRDVLFVRACVEMVLRRTWLPLRHD